MRGRMWLLLNLGGTKGGLVWVVCGKDDGHRTARPGGGNHFGNYSNGG